RIAEIACLELEAWTGRMDEPEHATRGEANLLLAVSMRKQPTLSFKFALLCKETAATPEGRYVPSNDATDSVKLALNGGAACLAEASFPEYLQLVADEGIDIGRALAVNLTLSAIGHKGASLTRRWKPLVVTRFSPELRLFVEVKRVEIGEPLLLLVHESIADSVCAHLNRIASGYRQASNRESRAVPRNWRVLLDVRVAGVLNDVSDDLQALVPVATTNVSLEGGFGLPSRGSWHAVHPPRINIATLISKECEVELITERLETDNGDDFEEERRISLGTFKQEFSFDLAGCSLSAGDYRIVVAERREEGQG